MSHQRTIIHIDYTNDGDYDALLDESKALGLPLAGYCRYLIKTHPKREKSPMKILGLIVIALLFITSCGKDEPGTPGPQPLMSFACSDKSSDMKWINTWSKGALGSRSVMQLNPSCTGKEDTCDLEFSYTKPDEATGQTTLNVTQTNGKPGCPGLGETVCAMLTYESIFYDHVLLYSCGGPVLTYISSKHAKDYPW